MAKKTILVVDDSRTDFLYVSKILMDNGYEVSHAPSGKDAIDDSKRIMPDCILMDVVMPEMNGFQATRAISRESTTSEIPILMLSSKSQQTDRIWAERQGAKGYLVKPVDPKELIAKLNEFI